MGFMKVLDRFCAGVLNSEELSMITGSGSLSVIHEEASCDSDSAYLQDLDENLFKVVPGSTPKKDRITGSSPLSKHASPARDNSVTGSAVSSDTCVYVFCKLMFVAPILVKLNSLVAICFSGQAEGAFNA